MLAVIIFFTVVLLFESGIKTFTKYVAREVIQVSDFTAIVTGLPKNATATEVNDFCTQFVVTYQ